MGDRKTKHCRQCAVEGSPCFELWNAVKSLAARRFVLVNQKPGRAYGHRYQLEPPKKKPMLCYLQTLQDKHAHFGLPIEDFLYVTRTGLGGMYETPSRTKQQPFVGLILEQIAKAPEIPKGAGLIEDVRAIPRKNQS
ncbi:MAG TPA: hypothetical protein VLH35_00555 [Candidatus Acidoferrales bacterium]|nr:hypothetical protein [Candidatus Acidoferrales bacterium]